MDVKNITKDFAVVEYDNGPNGQMYKVAGATIWFPWENVDLQVEAKANAELITEAFNVANESGFSPRQLLEQRDLAFKAISYMSGLMRRGLTSGYIKSEFEKIEKELIRKTKKP